MKNFIVFGLLEINPVVIGVKIIHDLCAPNLAVL